jgi:hypothetical protein
MIQAPLASARAALLAVILLAATVAATPARQGHGILPEATPEADPGAWSVVERQELEVDGEFVTLSPDGQWIAGLGPDFELCVWEVATLAATCAEQEFPIEADSIRWAPDSTAVAWSVHALRYFYDSDIFLMELPGGDVVDLTDDGFADSLPLGSEDDVTFPVDIMPAWTPDSESLVFVRSVWSTTDDDETIPTDLMSIARAGGEPTEVALVRDDFPWAVFFPIFVLDDGSLLYSVSVNDLSDRGNGIWLMDPAGESTQLLGGADSDTYPGVAIVDVRESGDGLLISGYSAYLAGRYGVEANPSFLLDTATGTLTPLGRDADTTRPATPVRFSPDETATVGVEWRADEPHLIVRDETGASDLGAIEPSHGMLSRGYDWATSNVILVPHLSGGGILLTVALD